METVKMAFALTAMVALAGVVFSSMGIAAAADPKFLTVHAAEQNNFTNVAHACNSNYLYSQNGVYNCRPCYDRAGDNGYGNNQLYCTPKADQDCPVSGDQNHPTCNCAETSC